MGSLEKKGYRISIDSWIGKLGNHLIQLSGALNVAKNTESTLTIPEHPILKRRKFDFTNSDNGNCLESISGRFFFKTDCYQFPFEFDRDRRQIFQDHVYELLVAKSLKERMALSIRRSSSDDVGEDTLVINIRSGRDIFRTDQPPLKDYMQPPLSFYKHVIESNGHEDCLIVTEPSRANPCVDALLAWNPTIRIKAHTSVKDDLQTILSATHLVMCHSTFSWCLALMSKNLRRLYLPQTFPLRGVGAFATDTYRFENYIEPGEWKCSPEQLDMMVNHSVNDIGVSHMPIFAGRPSDVEPSAFW